MTAEFEHNTVQPLDAFQSFASLVQEIQKPWLAVFLIKPRSLTATDSRTLRWFAHRVHLILFYSSCLKQWQKLHVMSERCSSSLFYDK